VLSYSSFLFSRVANPCQPSGNKLILFFLESFDVTVTVDFPDPEGTRTNVLWADVWGLAALCVVESSDACISGYKIPLPPTPSNRLIRGTFAVMSDRLVTALDTS
jgi:hypothetical protein